MLSLESLRNLLEVEFARNCRRLFLRSLGLVVVELYVLVHFD